VFVQTDGSVPISCLLGGIKRKGMKGKFHQLMSSAALASHRTPCRCNLTTAVLPHWAASCCSTLPHRQHHPSALCSTTLPHSVLSLHLHVVMRCALTLARTLVHTSWHEHAEDRRHHHPPKASMQPSSHTN
jgi:hypothetical protein